MTVCRADVEQVPTWCSKAERVREAFLEERKDRMQYPEPIAKLIESYMKLPGIGQKTATRLAFFTIDMKDESVNEFARSLISVKRDLRFCSVCGNITEEDPCEICSDTTRDRGTILVV